MLAFVGQQSLRDRSLMVIGRYFPEFLQRVGLPYPALRLVHISRSAYEYTRPGTSRSEDIDPPEGPKKNSGTCFETLSESRTRAVFRDMWQWGRRSRQARIGHKHTSKSCRDWWTEVGTPNTQRFHPSEVELAGKIDKGCLAQCKCCCLKESRQAPSSPDAAEAGFTCARVALFFAHSPT